MTAQKAAAVGTDINDEWLYTDYDRNDLAMEFEEFAQDLGQLRR